LKKNKSFAQPSFKDQDKVIFLGDSISQAGVLANGYITLTSKVIAKAYPNLNIKLIGAGMNGHKVPNCQQRLDRDVLQKNPSIVFIYLGVNDVWHWQHHKGTTAADFEAGLRDMVARIQSYRARVVLCTPSVIGEKTEGTNKYDAMLDAYADISRAVADETGSELLDLRHLFMNYLKIQNHHNVKSGIFTIDGVHLNKQGNKFVSELVLKALHVPLIV